MERPALKLVADNPSLTDALREELTEAFLGIGIQTDGGMSDTQLGQMYRARIVGLQVVEDVFKKIAKYRSVPSGVEKRNEAR